MPRRTGILVAFGAIYLIWGSTYLAISKTVADVPPVFMVGVRGMLAGGALYWWARRRGAAPVTARELIAMLPTATLLFAGGYTLVGWAEQQVPSGAAALLNSTTPAWVVLFEWLSRRRTRPAFQFGCALMLGFAGVWLLVRGNTNGALPVIPALACVLASVAWAAGMVRARQRANGDPMRDAAIQLLTGGLLLLPLSAAAGEFGRVAAGLALSSLASLAYLVVVGSLVGYTAYVWLLHNVPASKVASHAYVNPLIAVVVGATLGNERLYATTAAAALLILVSVFYIVKEKSGVSPADPQSARPALRKAVA